MQSVSRVSFLMNPFPFSHNHLGVLQSYVYLVLAVVALFLGLRISTASILTSRHICFSLLPLFALKRIRFG